MALPSQLTDTGDEFDSRFKQESKDTRSEEFAALLAELQAWLGRCVQHGRFLPPGSADRRSLQGLVDYWTSRLQGVGHPLNDIDRLEAFDAKAGNVLADDQFPYHGLIAATGSTRKVFAGRDDQIEEYADHIDRHAALLIQSESGGGKSSVAMAGVLPELQRRHADWLLVPRLTPGTQPADALRAALKDLLGLQSVDAGSVAAALAGRTLLIYVDQLEELLTMCTDVTQQAAFSELLAELAGPEDPTGPGPFRLLATMRVDHYERLANSEYCRPLYQLLARENSVKTLPPMSLAQIRSVILKPAEAIGLRFVPPSIVEKLASETANAPSGLPLLQFALQRLWDERPRLDNQPDGPGLDMITEETFAKLPTVSAALGTVAERYYAEMQAQGLVDACRRLMLELTVIDERLEVPLRRRRSEPEVQQTLVAAGYATAAQAQALVDGLVERRLLVRTGEGATQQIEVAHEALFRYWPRFQDWIYDEQTRTTLRETRQIARDALLWERGRRSSDLLNLRGEPLQRALVLRRELWLEPQAAAYVDACARAAQEAEQREAQTARALADLEAQRAQAMVEAEKRKFEAAKAASAARRARKWNRLVIGGGAVITSLLLATVGFGVKSLRDSERARLANIMSMAFVMPQVPPMEAVDLAFTIDRRLKLPESLSTLAHAIDDTGHATKAGDRKHGPAEFTASGLATIQLVGADQALVRPLGSKLDDLQPPVKVTLVRRDGETLASLDVGPASAAGVRLVIASFVVPGRSMSRFQVFAIDRGSSEARPLQEMAFPTNARNASLFAFDGSGTRLAVAARLLAPGGGNRVESQLVQWQVGQAAPQVDGPVGEPAAVTALAYVQDQNGLLIKGRSDGQIDCGARGLTQYVEGSPRVVELTTAGSTRFAALHADNSIVVGDCSKPEVVNLVQESGSLRPGQMSLRTVEHQGDNGIELSYVLGGRLVCQRLMGDLMKEANCAGRGLVARAAVPAFDPSGRVTGYRLLDSEGWLMSFWPVDASAGHADEVRGVPVAREEPAEAKWSSAAVSPNGRHRLGIETVAGRALRVQRLGTDGNPGNELEVASPGWAAVNDQGLAVVLATRETKDRHKLTTIGLDGKRSSVPTFNDAACMKLSPDGQHALVVSDRWGARRFALGEQPPAGREVAEPVKLGLADVVTACAAGNGPEGTVVLASESGRVQRFDPKRGEWVPLSQLVPFALGAAALDISIDAGSRFVAVISKRRALRCRNGDGHLLRIWDLQLERPDYPVASACIERELRAIGPIEKANGTWQLPMFHLTGDGAGGRAGAPQRTAFVCRACGDSSREDAPQDRIRAAAEELGAVELEPTDVKSKYGIDLPSRRWWHAVTAAFGA